VQVKILDYSFKLLDTFMLIFKKVLELIGFFPCLIAFQLLQLAFFLEVFSFSLPVAGLLAFVLVVS